MSPLRLQKLSTTMLSFEENAIANVKSYVLESNNRLLPLFLFHLVATQPTTVCMNLFLLKPCNIFKIKLNTSLPLFITSKSIDGNNLERIILT